jgi:hypothetical protein
METNSKEEAQKLINFYSPQIIDKQISSNIHESFKVTSVIFELIDLNKGFVYCIANYNFDVFKRNLINYVNDFNLIHPSDVLNK